MIEVSQKVKKCFFVGIIGSFILLIFLLFQLPDKLFHIYFLDIGQGDSILIKTPENHQILIDGGPGNKVIEELGQVLPYFDKSLDLVVLTHPDLDHLSGLVEVLKRYEVENVLLTGVDEQKADYQEFLLEILQQNIQVFVAESASDFSFGEVVFDIIYPFQQMIGEKVKNANNSSVSIKVIYKDKVILLTGDLELEGEEELTRSGLNLKADIYKAGHHGSKTSSSLKFLQKIKPEIVVIQSGLGNNYGHPHKEVLENLEKIGVKQIHRNDLEGRIEFVF